MRGLVVVTPAHIGNAQLAIAAARAGQTGILDLGYDDNLDRAAAVRLLAEQSGQVAQREQTAPWGCRWDTLGAASRSVSSLAGLPAQPWPWLVLAGIESRPEALAQALADARRLAAHVVLEVTSLAEAQAAEAASFDGLIVKGCEAGGRVGQQSSFVLLQQLHGRIGIPYWIQGGIGPDTAAAAFLAGAAGVVLNEQLWLTAESPLDLRERRRWSRLDGSETQCVGAEGVWFRVFSRATPRAMQDIEKALADGAAWPEYLRARLTARGQDTSDRLLPLGQEIAFAGQLAEQHYNVAGVLAAYRQQVEANLKHAAADTSLTPGAALAEVHGTRYPIVQGPMARVSDVAPFCAAVAEHGALPVLALVLMHGEELDRLLSDTRQRLGTRPWGVGILGFAPERLRRNQTEAVIAARPPFAIIAGGQPAQARPLEEGGISTYLHVPSPGLLEIYLAEGARKFVFEGQECGGHIGPRSSFALWQSAIDTLCRSSIPDPERLQVIFAGGIHDALSAAMVAAGAARLTARGAKIGVLAGSAYLFTEEAVACGAIGAEYQRQVLACDETVLLESGLGYQTRCVDSAYAEEFNALRRDLIRQGKSSDEIRLHLEKLHLGRLRLAAKGLIHGSTAGDSGAVPLQKVDETTQRRAGVFMVGQIAALHKEPVPMAELHRAMSDEATALLARLAARPLPWHASRLQARPAEEPIAIIGMGCLLPHAADLKQYWSNILRGVDATDEIPRDRWNIESYFSADRLDEDGVYGRRGAFLGSIVFDPLKWRITPASLKYTDPIQLMALEVARRTMADAGYTTRDFCRRNAGVVFASSGASDLGAEYCFRTMSRHILPDTEGLDDAARQRLIAALEKKLPVWTEDSFPGMLANIVASRIANRLDMCGSTYAVDAACAASLAALQTAIHELRLHKADLMLVGATDGTNNAFCYMSFARTQALSPRDRSTPFDDAADGLVLGEGIAAVLLKRLADAERDGDKIYAVIRGIGSSSDGRNRSMTAPYPPGQALAVRRAYEDAGVSPLSVTLIEAHGTGTKSGDNAEIASLGEAFQGARPQQVAIGSVKSMIGHTKMVAGMASLIKTALALKHRVLPPTIGVSVPNRQIDFVGGPFYVNTETRPWIAPSAEPRRAGVSAFGFGGTNFHVVLEEYRGDYHTNQRTNFAPRDAEIFCWQCARREEIVAALRKLDGQLASSSFTALDELAHCLHGEERLRPTTAEPACRLAIVASTVDDLRTRLARAMTALAENDSLRDPSGIYYSEKPPVEHEQVAFLYPGQGSQAVNMLRELLVISPWAEELFARADALLADLLPQPLSRYLYPLPALPGQADAKRQEAEITDTRVAQPALAVVERFATELLRRFGIEPGMVAGHSFGEYSALAAAGVLSEEQLLRLAALRGRIAAEAERDLPGTMAMLQTDAETARSLAGELDVPFELANLNAPDQTVIGGPRPVIERAIALAAGKGVRARAIPVSAAFHTSSMAPAAAALAKELAAIEFRAAELPIYSNTQAERYPFDGAAIKELLAQHIRRPVLFERQIRRMHNDGARVFVEVGPGRVLSSLVERILPADSCTALSTAGTGAGEVGRVAQFLAQAFALGLPMRLDAWFEGRGLQFVQVADLLADVEKAKPKPTDWILAPGKAEPVTPLPGSRKKPAPKDMLVQASPLPDRVEQASRLPDRVVQANCLQEKVGETPALQSPPPAPQYIKEEHEMDLSAAAPGTSGNGRPTKADLLAENQALMAQWMRVTEHFLQVQEKLLDDRTNLRSSSVGSNGGRVAPSRLVPAGARAPIITPAMRQSLGLGDAPAKPTAVRPAPQTHVSGNGNVPTVPTVRTSVTIAEDGSILFPPPEIFRTDLLNAVSERTGYPLEMLDEDLDLEAGLGIDSIKAIEIFAGLRQYRVPSMEQNLSVDFEEFSRVRTLRQIVGAYASWSQRLGQPGGVELLGLPAPAAAKDTGAVEKYHLRAVEAPHAADAAPRQLAGQTALVVAEAGVWRDALAAELAARGCRVVHVAPGPRVCRIDADHYEADFLAADSVRELHATIKDSGEQPGLLIHLLPLGTSYCTVMPLAAAGARTLAQGLFQLLQTFAADLLASTASGGGQVLNVTPLGGQFGLDAPGVTPWWTAGTLGVCKTLHKECPSLQVKCVDVDATAGAAALVPRLIDELESSDDLVEVGLRARHRYRLDLEKATLSRAATGSAAEPGAVVLVTGGARGITAEAAKSLAAARPRLVIVGRTPPDDEPAEPRALDAAALRSYLIEQNKTREPPATPKVLEDELRALLRRREVRGNLAAMEAAGATVEYHALDVRDEVGFGQLIDDIYARHGRIDGVLHGAGVVEDKLIREKTGESFANVFRTKVDSTLVLAEKLRPAELKFFVLFSSVSARFGSVGQADYSAANEVLNKLADDLKRRWPGRVVSVNWGPWAGGMVTADLQRLYQSLGIALIPLDKGLDVLATEIRTPSGPAEVVVTCSMQQIAAANLETRPA